MPRRAPALRPSSRSVISARSPVRVTGTRTQRHLVVEPRPRTGAGATAASASAGRALDRASRASTRRQPAAAPAIPTAATSAPGTWSPPASRRRADARRHIQHGAGRHRRAHPGQSRHQFGHAAAVEHADPLPPRPGPPPVECITVRVDRKHSLNIEAQTAADTMRQTNRARETPAGRIATRNAAGRSRLARGVAHAVHREANDSTTSPVERERDAMTEHKEGALCVADQPLPARSGLPWAQRS
jgi:hypothetical protein